MGFGRLTTFLSGHKSNNQRVLRGLIATALNLMCPVSQRVPNPTKRLRSKRLVFWMGILTNQMAMLLRLMYRLSLTMQAGPPLITMTTLSLSSVFIVKKLITLNEKNKSALNNPAPIPGCHAPVKAIAHCAVVIQTPPRSTRIPPVS